ncbi:hypothetical protein [Hymenobacter edaphi]|uniref:Outer membrane protein beta-barrel domain-containing protein n=1 Tax=Hymenobacter edaphi TaxID=2211146 RepID=A0A328BEJ5_9BACT|nr:hypothetical protein [Hymenobacter edaphi]RAK65752.1 hypothetical protein DLM85_13600 [Hymenobacter edaphi]
MLLSSLRRLLPFALLLAVGACSAPRSIISSGKVTPKGQFKAGGNLGFNIGTASIGKITGAAKDVVQQAINRDTIRYEQGLDRVQAAALAYVLDPTVATSDLYVRYGLLNRVDVGYKYSFGAHSFDAMYQFMGPLGTPEKPQGQSGDMYGSVGLQFSTQKAKLPSIPFLEDTEKLLGFTARRVDLLVPLVFSTSFGPEEQIGNVSYGLVYSRTFLKYGFQPGKIFNYIPGSNRVTDRIPNLLERRSYGAIGGFVNLKVGYRYAYFLPALAIYYQNFGTYKILNNKETKLKGVTILPTLGLQFRIPAGKNR